MIHRKHKRVVIHLFITILLVVFSSACSEGFNPGALLNGSFDSPLTISISVPEYKQVARFGDERRESLNRLLRHIGITVTMDGRISETTLTIDGDPVFSYCENEDDDSRQTVYSFQPDTLYEYKKQDTGEYESSFPAFLDGHFFMLNRLLDELYPVFEKSAEAFAEYGKPSSASLNFSGYGKGVRKLTIPLPDQYIKEHFPGMIAGLAETDECRRFLESLIFSGPQKIILLYDQNDRLLRINYDGTVGLTEESMRRVSIVWRCLRSDSQKKDNLTLKTPSVKGYDKYNITYERQADLSEQAFGSVSWDLQIDLKADQLKKKISFTADLAGSDNIINGKILFTEKQDGSEEKLSIIPELQKNGSEYSGTIEITNNSGKIITSSLQIAVHVFPGKELTAPGPGTLNVAETISGNDPVHDQINSMLIRRLLVLPAEDLVFLSMDIPDDDWNSLIQSLF